MMTQFSDSFRKNVTIRGALSAMLFSEEKTQHSELATKVQIAIENMHHDIVILSSVHKGFSSNATEDDALEEILKLAVDKLRQDKKLLPDEAILLVIDKHHERIYPTQKDAQALVDVFKQDVIASAREFTLRW